MLLVIGCVALSVSSLRSEGVFRPVPQPDFEITFFGPSIVVKNIDDVNTTNVHVRRSLTGELIIFGKDKTVIFPKIAFREEKEAKRGWIFGFGPTTITISVWCDEGVNLSTSHPAKSLLFLIKIL
jgi:hypothetical protein